MKAHIAGSPSFSHLHVDLEPGESIAAESGAMQAMAPGMAMKTVLNGGFFSGLSKKLFGGESLFINHFSNEGAGPARVTLAQNVPGQIVEFSLAAGSEIYLQKGAYLAHGGDAELTVTWAGLPSLFAAEGLLRLRAKAVDGDGRVWFGAYGGIVEREVDGELKVDDGHLVAYSPSLSLKVGLAGGLFASITGGEGFVSRVIGRGTVYLQTRSIRALAAWLNPKFR
jgi:uncharacterized protein (TIGR00266 family)